MLHRDDPPLSGGIDRDGFELKMINLGIDRDSSRHSLSTFCQLSARLRIDRDDPPPSGGIDRDGFELKMVNLGIARDSSRHSLSTFSKTQN